MISSYVEENAKLKENFFPLLNERLNSAYKLNRD